MELKWQQTFHIGSLPETGWVTGEQWMMETCAPKRACACDGNWFHAIITTRLLKLINTVFYHHQMKQRL